MTSVVKQVQLSVRALVQYVYSAGSIEIGFQAAGQTALQDGVKMHQLIQQQYKESDQKEVHLQTVILHGHIEYLIEGRCDGLLLSENIPVIEEIKSTRLDLIHIAEDSYPVHWAQAIVYAYIYGKDKACKQVDVQITYIHVQSKEQKHYRKRFSLEDLEVRVHEMIACYAPYAEMMEGHRSARDNSMKRINFPFTSYREGQRKLAGAVYTAISQANHLLVKAPTGIGKTMSTIFPTLKAMGEGMVKRVFYLTAKTITRTAAEDALQRLQGNGMVMHAVTLTAKDKVCFQEETRCQKEYCEFADGYYDRLNEGLLDLLSHETLMTRQVIEKYARKHRLCPFELSLDAAYASDMIIADYNYIFDPRVSLKRLLDESKRDSVLLIDEAHNLVDRGREMYSASITKSAFLQLKRDFKDKQRGIYDAANAINKHFIALRKQIDDQHHQYIVMSELPAELLQLMEMFVTPAEFWLSSGQSSESQELLLETYYKVQSFLRIAQMYDTRYVTYTEASKQDITVKMFCMDPSVALDQISKSFRAKIYFSATLTPMPYYRYMLGAGDDPYTLTLPSPFHSEQLDVRIVPLSTRYKDRAHTKEILVDMLVQLIEEEAGNYFIFFPSYSYMQEVYTSYMERVPQAVTLRQESSMTEEEREQFLSAFQSNRNETLVGFAVLGGIFSEGIDLVGDALNRVVVVGVGLPQIGLERDLIKQYFDRIGRTGFDYAYVYPGMNKVLQAGGRLIRTEEDSGLLVLIDDRFTQPPYYDLLPIEWKQ